MLTSWSFCITLQLNSNSPFLSPSSRAFMMCVCLAKILRIRTFTIVPSCVSLLAMATCLYLPQHSNASTSLKCTWIRHCTHQVRMEHIFTAIYFALSIQELFLKLVRKCVVQSSSSNKLFRDRPNARSWFRNLPGNEQVDRYRPKLAPLLIVRLPPSLPQPSRDVPSLSPNPWPLVAYSFYWKFVPAK